MSITKKSVMVPMLGLGIVMMSSQQLLKASPASIGSFFTSLVGSSTVLTNIVQVNGISVAGTFLTSLQAILTELNQNYPQQFSQFVQYCLNNSNGVVTQDVLAILQKYNLVQDNATVSSVIQSLVAALVTVNADGSITFVSTNQLIQDGIIILLDAETASLAK